MTADDLSSPKAAATGAETRRGSPVIIDRDGLAAMIQTLVASGQRVIGPRERDDAIVYEPISGLADLPAGLRVATAPGAYRLERAGDALFDHAVAAFPWKRYLHPPRETLYTTRVTDTGLEIIEDPVPETGLVFLGVRACDLAALHSLDSVLCDGPYPDARYAERRRRTMVIAVNCRVSVDTCFCASMATGPRVGAGADMVLTELTDGAGGQFLAEALSDSAAKLLAGVPSEPAGTEDTAEADRLIAEAAAQQTRRIDKAGAPDLLAARAEDPHWEHVAKRCLSCANCTMVCPTCFCSSSVETSDLQGTSATRERHWASCFTMDFSFLHEGPVRPGVASRYRQWMTHKLGTWQAQFGTDGCTGCGRCIAWCPAGIDLTAELAALKEPR